MNAENTIFQDNGTYGFTAKVVDLSTMDIKYQVFTDYRTEEEAKKAAKKADKRYEEAIKQIKKNEGRTFISYLKDWFEDVQSYTDCTYQTGYAWTIYHIIIPNTEDIPIEDITEEFITKLLKKCTPICESAAPMVYKLLHLVMKDIVAEGYLLTNPMDYISPPRKKIPKTVHYEKNQIRELLDGCKDYHSIYWEVLMALFCGLRPGEIRGLKITDFDLEQNTVHVCRQIGNNFKLEVMEDNSLSFKKQKDQPKAVKSESSDRILGIPKLIKEQTILRYQENKTKRCLPEWEGYLSLGTNGKLKGDYTYNNALKNICRGKGLPRITMHQLRHLYASILLEENVPLETISKMMGHRSITTTLNIYCSIIEAKKDIRNFAEENLDPLGGIGV